MFRALQWPQCVTTPLAKCKCDQCSSIVYLWVAGGRKKKFITTRAVQMLLCVTLYHIMWWYNYTLGCKCVRPQSLRPPAARVMNCKTNNWLKLMLLLTWAHEPTSGCPFSKQSDPFRRPENGPSNLKMTALYYLKFVRDIEICVHG